MSTVADLMTRVLITVEPTQTVAYSRKAMMRGGVRHLPVVNPAGQLVGMLSHVDLPDMDDDAAIADTMALKPITVSPDTFLSESVVLMLQHRINSLPVVDVMGNLVGILSSTDLLIEAFDVLHKAEIGQRASQRTRIGVENTVLRAKLERVAMAHHADMRAIALSELRRFLTRHYEREESAHGLFVKLVDQRPELGADVAELTQAHAEILSELEALETANRDLAAQGEAEPSPGTSKLIAAIEQHEKLQAALAEQTD